MSRLAGRFGVTIILNVKIEGNGNTVFLIPEEE